MHHTRASHVQNKRTHRAQAFSGTHNLTLDQGTYLARKVRVNAIKQNGSTNLPEKSGEGHEGLISSDLVAGVESGKLVVRELLLHDRGQFSDKGASTTTEG